MSFCFFEGGGHVMLLCGLKSVSDCEDHKTVLHCRLFHSLRCQPSSAAALILPPEVDQTLSETIPPLRICNFDTDGEAEN